MSQFQQVRSSGSQAAVQVLARLRCHLAARLQNSASALTQAVGMIYFLVPGGLKTSLCHWMSAGGPLSGPGGSHGPLLEGLVHRLFTAWLLIVQHQRGNLSHPSLLSQSYIMKHNCGSDIPYSTSKKQITCPAYSGGEGITRCDSL